MCQSSIPARVARADQEDLPKVGALGEAKHRPGSPLHKPVIGMLHHLLDNIIKVLTLSDFHTPIFISVVLFDGRGIGATFVDINQAGFAAGADSLGQKKTRCFLITPDRQ
jgi:hypothetical protein